MRSSVDQKRDQAARLMHQTTSVKYPLGILAFLLVIATLGNSYQSGRLALATETSGVAAAKGVVWQIEPMWGKWPKTDWAGVTADARDMRAAGITWARIDVRQDNYSADYLDRVVAIAESYNIQLLGLVLKGPPAASLGTAADRQRYRTWLSGVTYRYSKTIRYWEIHNEPNLNQYWRQPEAQDNGDAYARAVQDYVLYLKDSYETIKAVDNTAQVLLGGLSSWKATEFVEQLIDAQAYRYIDIVAFHPYGSSPDEVAAALDTFRVQLEDSGQPELIAKPIWITEIGFHSEADWADLPGHMPSERKKAEALTAVMSKIQSRDLQTPIFWYVLHEAGDYNGYGLLRRDPDTGETTYLPSYYAYQRLISSDQQQRQCPYLPIPPYLQCMIRPSPILFP
jgi:hypothetical protein